MDHCSDDCVVQRCHREQGVDAVSLDLEAFGHGAFQVGHWVYLLVLLRPAWQAGDACGDANGEQAGLCAAIFLNVHGEQFAACGDEGVGLLVAASGDYSADF